MSDSSQNQPPSAVAPPMDPLAVFVLDTMPTAVVITDQAGIILRVNPAFTRITGYRPDEAVGSNPSILRSGRQSERFYQRMWQSLRDRGHWHGEIWNRRKNGDIYPEWLTIGSIRDDTGAVRYYVGIFSEISELALPEQRQLYLAYHDALTGLSNRPLLDDRLKRALARARREGRRTALIHLDLDNFRAINDRYDFLVGDRVLQHAAQRLSNCLRDSDTLARLSGDSFAVIPDDVSDIEEVVAVARKLLASLRSPMPVGEHQIVVTGSIGIAFFPDDAGDPMNLAAAAHEASQRARRLGGDRYAMAMRRDR